MFEQSECISRLEVIQSSQHFKQNELKRNKMEFAHVVKENDRLFGELQSALNRPSDQLDDNRLEELT